MEHFEMVEKLVLKTGVNYEDAKAALEACNWDILDALVYLEKLGKVKNGTAYYTTGAESKKTAYEQAPANNKDVSFGELCGRLVGFIGRLIDQGNHNYIDISRQGRHILSLSLTVMVILLLLGFWVIIPLMVVGLFFQFRYHFRGTSREGEINDLLDRASNAAESVKKEMKGKQ